MNIGDTVRIKGIPPNLPDCEELQTRRLFEKCLGKTFVVAGVEMPEGLGQQLLRLDVGHVVGEESYKHTIWIEEEFVEVVECQVGKPCRQPK